VPDDDGEADTEVDTIHEGAVLLKKDSFINEEKQKVREETIKKKQRLKETIAQAITSITRIAHQLKEDHNVEPSNVVTKLSVCGLRLEHMVATLYKKKPTFNIESVNTVILCLILMVGSKLSTASPILGR